MSASTPWQDRWAAVMMSNYGTPAVMLTRGAGSRVWDAALPTGSEGATQGGFEGSHNATYFTTGSKTSGCQHVRTVGYGAGNCEGVDATGIVYAIFMQYPNADAKQNRKLRLTTPQVCPFLRHTE